MEGRIVCHSCNGKTLQTFEAPDPWTLLMMAESAVLGNHVCPPHAASHHLRVVLEGPLDVLKGLKHPLRIQCFQPNCRVERVMRTECEPWFVNSAAIAFHSSHEGHKMQITYGTGEKTWVIESPGITDEMRKQYGVPNGVPTINPK